MTTIDESIENAIKEESAQTKAVSSLLEVKPKIKGVLGSDIELKTDLSENEVKLHTAVDIMDHILSMNKKEFSHAPLLGKLTNLKERKALSKNRKSRGEIVDVARSPDQQFINDASGGGFVKRFLTPRKEQNINR